MVHRTRGGGGVVGLHTNQVVKTIQTGPAPDHTVFIPVFTRDRKRAFASNSGNGGISEIDPVTWKVTCTPDAGPAPENIMLSTDEKML